MKPWKGHFWYHESYDRIIRDRDNLYRTICYVLDNPIKATQNPGKAGIFSGFF